jgi:hypothetical protein
MQSLTIHDTEARGRNGWFRAALVTLFADEGRIHVDIMSKRAVCPAPICLQLSLRDAANLGTSIARLARDTMKAARRSLSKRSVGSHRARKGARPERSLPAERSSHD